MVETSIFTTISWEMDSQRKEVRVRKDPWARFEAWRYHPAINKRANMRNFLPGFWWGVGAFVIAIGIEKLFEKPDDHGEHHWLPWILYSSKKYFYRFCVVKKLLYGSSDRYFCTKDTWEEHCLHIYIKPLLELILPFFWPNWIRTDFIRLQFLLLTYFINR